jgi:hypothetical protein
MGLNVVLHALQTIGDGYVAIPFGFQINGTSDPDNKSGALASVVRSEAGEFLCTLRRELRPYACIFGFAEISTTADDVDLQTKTDWSTVVSAGTFVVRMLTGAVQTDPTDNTLVGGVLLVKTNRRSLWWRRRKMARR